MKTFETALEDIYARINVKKAEEKRRNRKIIKIASTCATLSVVVVLSVVFVWRPFDDNKDTETESIYTLSGKLSISQIPGAKVVENPEYFVVENSKGGSYATPERYIETVKSFPSVIGEVVDMTCVTVRGEFFITWTITSFDIKITEAVTQPIESDIITCVTVCRYRNGISLFNSKCGLSDVAYDITQNPNGFFVLQTETSPGNEFVINGETFDFSEYADYYVGVRFDYEEDEFIYHGFKIKFDDIRYK